MEATELLKRVEMIEASPELTAKFREKYGTPFIMVKTAISGNMIKKSAVNYIKSITKL